MQHLPLGVFHMPDKISVIVPIYNVEPYIRQCLAALSTRHTEICRSSLWTMGCRTAAGEVVHTVLIVKFSDYIRAGVETYLFNALSNMDRTDMQIDYLNVGHITDADAAAELRSAGVNVIALNIDHARQDSWSFRLQQVKDCLLFAHRLSKICQGKTYDAIHINDFLFLEHAITLRVAKAHGIKKRASHAHNTGFSGSRWKRFAQNICRKSILRNATDLLACSYPAAVTAFGEQAAANVRIIKYGIETQKFAFSEEVRRATRKALGVADDVFLLGHVGRFDTQKNHKFLIDAFKAVTDRYTGAKLVLLGGGSLEEDVRRQVRELGLEDSVIFAGVTPETEKYYCAMDLFVFPSAWEGLGIVNLEAQASGLSCVVSDQVPRQADVTGCVEFLPLGDTALWAERILRHRAEKDIADRRDAWQAVRRAGYDIGDAANELHAIYTGMTRGGGYKSIE